MKLFKQRPTKEQRRESKRRWDVVKDKIYPLLVEECETITDMKRRLECVKQVLEEESVKQTEAFKKQAMEDTLKSWNLKPLEGKGARTEQKIIDILEFETINVVDQILTHLPRVIDTFIMEEMSKRHPASLKVTFPE